MIAVAVCVPAFAANDQVFNLRGQMNHLTPGMRYCYSVGMAYQIAYMAASSHMARSYGQWIVKPKNALATVRHAMAGKPYLMHNERELRRIQLHAVNNIYFKAAVRIYVQQALLQMRAPFYTACMQQWHASHSRFKPAH